MDLVVYPLVVSPLTAAGGLFHYLPAMAPTPLPLVSFVFAGGLPVPILLVVPGAVLVLLALTVRWLTARRRRNGHPFESAEPFEQAGNTQIVAEIAGDAQGVRGRSEYEGARG